MRNLLLTHILVCTFIFTILKISNTFLIILFFILILATYIYTGFVTIISGNKKIKYFTLGIIGLILFIASLIISPNQLPNKNIESSYVWTIVQIYLFPFEWPIIALKSDFLKYPSFIEQTGFYLMEIVKIGLLPFFGALIREKYLKKNKELKSI